jgi:O-succinylbenzoate synthase
LRLDANGAFDPSCALELLAGFAKYDIAFLEQPIRAGNWPLLADLCHLSPIPIALDEELIPIADADGRRRLLDTVQPQHLILKPALLGGFAAAEDWISDAGARGIQWWTNSLLESSIGLNAICQWTSAVGGDRIHGLGTGGLFTNNIGSPIRLVGDRRVYAKGAAWDLPGR